MGELIEPDQALGKPGMLGSQLHQARVWQEIRQQGEEFIFGSIHGIWGADTGLWLEWVDLPRSVPEMLHLYVGWLCFFLRPFHSNTNRNPWAQRSKVGDGDLGQV